MIGISVGICGNRYSRPNLVTNGDFSSGTNGVTAQQGAAISVTNGVLRVTNDSSGTKFGQAYMTAPTVPGRTYVAEVSRKGGTGTGVWHIGANASTGEYGTNLSASSKTFTATGSIAYIQLTVGGSSANAYYEWDNISLTEQ